MYSQEVLVKNLVMKIKQELFSPDVDLVSLVPPSPYDTAWLSMIPNPHRGSDEPLFKGCLDWVLQHQSIRGFWGDDDRVPTLGSLTSTLACIVALTTWDVGHDAIQKGLAFIHASTEKLLEQQNGTFPEWFVIVFPAMVELAQTKGLRVYFSHGSTALVEQVFQERNQIFQMNRLVQSGDQQQYYSLEFMQYLEALPETYDINSNETLLISQSEEDGLFIQSPPAIAYAFMKTGRKEFLSKLDSIVQRCGFSVPAIYPMDEDLLRVCLINRIERLGLAEHFMAEIKSMLGQVYRSRSYISCEEPKSKEKHAMPLHLYKDSLAFRLLRLHGYTVSPRKFCWFLDDEDIMVYIEEHHEIFLLAIYNVYRATDVTFIGESQLEDVKEFCRRILEKQTLKDYKNLVGPTSMTDLQDQIKHEISIPWLARLDHLEHRNFIEREEPVGPWTGRGLSYGLSCQTKGMLLLLAIENYSLRQSMFRNEVKELERWSKGMGLVEMGFARQKTAYCYFAVASTVSHSSLSYVRLALAKGAVIVTVADDFFDKEGPMNELEALANAVKRWQDEGLDGHGKTIFKALKDFADDISWQFFNQNGYDIKSYLQDLWQQTFVSWLKEAEWSRNGHPSSIAEYLQVATCSIASHTILLSAALLLSTPPELEILKSPQSHPLTNSLMVLTRLLNEIQSYQKEQEEGKPNLVLPQMKGNPNLGAKESIGIIQKMLDEKKKEFLEHALVINGINGDGMPEACKKLHLFCLKVFQMFFNSTNVFDSPTELLADINKAIYDPLRVDAQGISKKDKTKILASYGKSQTTCVMKVQGNLRKEFVAKPYLGYGVLSLKLRKPAIFMTFRSLKVCNYSGYWV